jgi:hypothetical protein
MLGFQGGVSIPLVKGGVKAPPAKRQCRAGPKAGARRGFTLGACGIIRLRVDVQHVLHRGDKRAAHFWDAPLFLQPRLEVAFFKTRRTLSSEDDSARPHATPRSVSKYKVQRLRPSGASRQASAIRCASTFASSFGWVPGRGRSSHAPAPLRQSAGECVRLWHAPQRGR